MNTHPQIFTSLSDELKNNIITFVDGFGNTKATFDFMAKQPKFCGIITKDIEFKIQDKTKSKYATMLNISGGYYLGSEYQNIILMVKIYKISVKYNIFGKKREYILMIMDNPYFDPYSDNYALRGRYKLSIYNICRHGVYVKYLEKIDMYISL